MNRKIIILILSIVIISFVFFDKNRIEVEGKYPAPTELVHKKKNRKKFKKKRSEYYKKLHKASPDIDWKELDTEFRRQKYQSKSELRRNFLNNSERSINHDLNIFRNRNIEGYWEEKGSNNLSGRIHTAEVDFSNDLLYCGSSGGNIWRGTIDGQNWESLNDYMQLPNITMLRIIETGSLRRLLIGTGSSRFYFTDNEGLVIEESEGLDIIHSWGSIKRTIVRNNDENTIYILAKEWNNITFQEVSSIYISNNLGNSFTKVWTTSRSLEHIDIWTPRYQENGLVYLLIDNEFFILNENFEIELLGELTDNLSGETRLTGGIDNGSIFLYGLIGEQLYFSNNGGENWLQKNSSGTYLFAINSFNSSNKNPNIIGMGGVDAYKSTDGGDTWGLVNNWFQYYNDPYNFLHADIPEIRWFINPYSNDEFALISTDGGIYWSNSQLSNVNNLSMNGLGVSQYYSTNTMISYPHLIWAGSQDQGIQRSINSGTGILNFEQIISGDYGHLSSSDGGESMWIVYPGFVSRILNSTNNWNSWEFEGEGYLWMPPIVEHPTNPSKCYLAGGAISSGNKIIELTDIGSSILANELPFNFNSTITAVDYSPINPNYMYASTYDGDFYYSDNSGVDWVMSSSFSGPMSHYFYGSTIFPSHSEFGKVIIAGSGYSSPGVYITFNHGETFEPMINGLPSTLIFTIAGSEDDEFVFAATEVGPYCWTSASGEWTDISGLGAPDQTYWSVEYIESMQIARFGTYGRGIWDFQVTGGYLFELGDINGDQIKNIQDIILIINFILVNLIPSENQYSASDMNEDELINVTDIILLVSIILNN
tara:strand:+ start:400 stop:2865 length:2466 start_codon:yes stop_codon:yes gene_type:complete